MLFETIVSFFASPPHLTVLIAFWTLAVVFFLYWHRRHRAGYLYAHLFFLLVPLLDFAIAVPCQMPFVQGLLTLCSVVWTRFVIYLIPLALISAVLLGFFIMPRFYKKMYRARQLQDKKLNSIAGKANVLDVCFWVLDTSRPLAFSFGKHVLLSIGLLELLNRKEQEAVVLHELCHVRNHSSASKFSVLLARWFSPLAFFASVSACVSAEEKSADEFAAGIQGTVRHLNSAKRKIEQFHRL